MQLICNGTWVEKHPGQVWDGMEYWSTMVVKYQSTLIRMLSAASWLAEAVLWAAGCGLGPTRIPYKLNGYERPYPRIPYLNMCQPLRKYVCPL